MNLYFEADGHLTTAAFEALATGTPDELTRLEIAEHLSFCDVCTERYTEYICTGELMAPPETLHPMLMRRLRQRTAELFINRYVGVGVAAGLTFLLWFGGMFTVSPTSSKPDTFLALTQFNQTLTEKTSNLGKQITDSINHIFNQFTWEGDSSHEKK